MTSGPAEERDASIGCRVPWKAYCRDVNIEHHLRCIVIKVMVMTESIL